MKIIIREYQGDKSSLEPLTCKRTVGEYPVSGVLLKDALFSKISRLVPENDSRVLSVSENFWISENLLSAFLKCKGPSVIRSEDGFPLAWLPDNGESMENANEFPSDDKSLQIKYPWHILSVHEELMSAIVKDEISGKVRENVTIDGHLVLGKGSVILPGVYIEGNVMIGENSKIGPNCYIRGATYIGDNCHVGQAVEIKNSILMNKVSAGHLSYIGDSIICPSTNFGAGTITANFRHDGKNHQSAVNGKILDTGRRKFGTVIGDNVHTGIHTGIYPGRKIWPGLSTLPGDIVRKDLK